MPYMKWENSFSEKERDRRWQLMREYMQSKGMDALLVLGQGMSQVNTGAGYQMQSLDRYLSGWANGCSIVFPLKGDPVLLGVMPGMELLWTAETPKEVLPWIEDVRVGATRGEDIVAVLREKSLTHGRVGVGLSQTGQGGNRGSAVGRALWGEVAKALPDAAFEDAFDDLHQLMLVKSGEELAFFRRASQAMEQAMIAVAKTVRVGATELDVHLAMYRTLLENGANYSESYLFSGPATATRRGRLWNFGVGSPRVFEPGDVVNCGCCFCYVGGIEAQGQLTVAIPPVSPENTECARLAEECYEEGLRTLRPGMTLDEAVKPMNAPLEKAGVWAMFPRMHLLNPNIGVGFGDQGSERRKREFYKEYYEKYHKGGGAGRPLHPGDPIVLKPGMTFHSEPDACVGRHLVNVGGNVIVTENGNEPLSEIGTKMRLAGEA